LDKHWLTMESVHNRCVLFLNTGPSLLGPFVSYEENEVL